MKKKLPFEDALENKLQHLPTPGEEASWQAMSQLLDKNEKRRPVFWRKRYFIFMLLALLLVSGLWGLFRNNETQADKNKNATAVISQNSKDNPVAAADTKNGNDHSATGDKTTLTETNGPESQGKSKETGTIKTKQTGQQVENKNSIVIKSQNTTNDVSGDVKIKTAIKDDNHAEDNGSALTINKKKLKPLTVINNNKKVQPGNDNNDIVNSKDKKDLLPKGEKI